MWFWSRKRKLPELTVLRSGGRIGMLEVQIVSDAGRVRSNNEDSAAAVFPIRESIRLKQGLMVLLADGMGGHKSGEVASAMAIEQVPQLFFSGKGKVEADLKHALIATNEAIYHAGMSNETYRGMGTTCTVLVFIGDDFYIGHIGDSRAYHLHRGALKRLTHDQTYVQQLLEKGTISPEEAKVHPQRNVLLQALGTPGTITPYTSLAEQRLEPDDAVMICSDGLHEYLSDDEIAAYLADGDGRMTAAQDMVDEAKRRGGHDNITVVLSWRAATGKRMEQKPTKELSQDQLSND